MADTARGDPETGGPAGGGGPPGAEAGSGGSGAPLGEIRNSVAVPGAAQKGAAKKKGAAAEGAGGGGGARATKTVLVDNSLAQATPSGGGKSFNFYLKIALHWECTPPGSGGSHWKWPRFTNQSSMVEFFTTVLHRPEDFHTLAVGGKVAIGEEAWDLEELPDGKSLLALAEEPFTKAANNACYNHGIFKNVCASWRPPRDTSWRLLLEKVGRAVPAGDRLWFRRWAAAGAGVLQVAGECLPQGKVTRTRLANAAVSVARAEKVLHVEKSVQVNFKSRICLNAARDGYLAVLH